jgi:glycosyltransferase involved in cell wall biosynthesis
MTISVIIPVYNAGRMLGEAVASVLAQTRVPDEVLVVDDGSTDGASDQVCRDYPDIKILRQANAGCSSARNNGIVHSKGNWLVFLDADDLLVTGAIESHLACLMAHPEAWIVWGQSEVMRPTSHGGFELTGYRRTLLHLSSMFFRRDAFSCIGLFDINLRRSEDMDWLARAKEAGLRVVRQDQVVHLYRHHANGLSSDTTAMQQSVVSTVKNALRRRRNPVANIQI